MSEFNWGVIEDGGTFESLTASLVNAADHGAKLYGRSGKDSGLDAKNSDGTIAYQAKFRHGMTMDVAIKSALEEFARIVVYQDAEHANRPHWVDVNTWVFVGNFRINANDDKKWNEKVVPKFATLGITAKYWSLETLEQLLQKHAEISSVFFGGENRVLISLTEASDLIAQEMIGSTSLENPVVNQVEAIERIKGFADSDKKILPILGPGGVGKTRLTFEALNQLESDGWRCFWGLPSSMGASSQWFRILNGSQKTIVALDNPDSFGLVRTVVEQLATSERANWKVVILLRNEKEEIFNTFSGNESFDDKLVIVGLSEDDSQQLVSSIVGNDQDPGWLHRVYNFTKGNPGWLCLIAELANKGKLQEFPDSADALSQAYVDSCLDSISDGLNPKARELIRWLSLWGTIRLKPDAEASEELAFLDEHASISHSEAKKILIELSKTKIVSNWGYRNSAFAVEPLTIRHQILTSWLLEKKGEGFVVAADGKLVLDQLLGGKIPSAESVFRTLTHVVDARLGDNDAVAFMEPLFSRLEEAANDNLGEQFAALTILEKVRSTDPERAIEVLKAMRENVSEPLTIEDEFWGSNHLTHTNLLSKMPWQLFEIAQFIRNPQLAEKLIVEFGFHIQLEHAGEINSEHGKKASELIKQVLCRSRNCEIIASPAAKIVAEILNDEEKWPVVESLLKGLLNPVHEFTDWTGTNTLSFARRPTHPGLPSWEAAKTSKEAAFQILENREQKSFTNRLWRILAKAHHDFHRVLFHEYVHEDDKPAFHAVLKSELERVHAFLDENRNTLSLTEATHVREFWHWYLQHQQEAKLKEIALACEEIYTGLNKWRLHDFFKFDYESKLAPETERVVAEFGKADDVCQIQEFFDEATSYLESARDGQQGGADNWRIGDLAAACLPLFDPTADAKNTLTQFVIDATKSVEASGRLAWTFSVSLWRDHLRNIKTGEQNIAEGLENLFAKTETPSDLMLDLYGFPHPKTIGPLVAEELSFFEQKRELVAPFPRFQLFGSFFDVDKVKIKGLVVSELSLLDELSDRNSSFYAFFRYLRFFYLRFGKAPDSETVDWLIQLLIEYKLDGAVLGDTDFEWMIKESGYSMNGQRFLALMQSRFELEKLRTAEDSYKVVPHEFRFGNWCKFDFSSPQEVAAFRELCKFGLEANFVSYYFMPKYLAKLDPSGEQIRAFVIESLESFSPGVPESLYRLAYLASAFNDQTEAWQTIAEPICRAAKKLKRSERSKVYFGLSKKETGVITSMPDEVPFHYTSRQKATEAKLQSEPSDSVIREYWNWAYGRAKDDLERETARVEEDFHA